MTDVVLEQQIEAPESSKTSHESVITRKPHAIQGTLPFSTISSEIKEKGELPETNDDADISKKPRNSKITDFARKRLEQVQRKLGYRDILRCIQDIGKSRKMKKISIENQLNTILVIKAWIS
ncbi:uncharacterized protein OCT59_002070 [Rhizophagus irregularis]|uniref:uncharacterized protein n=1 Tax=Rhizophagus irregularis TaxID=588596 RepID=UPI00331E9D34|nr:hypothetical protein OCT59_002070 [Rhizophagus irregularis]